MSRRRVAPTSGDLSNPERLSGAGATVSDDILASAIDDLASGFTPLEILERYPEHAAELAPLLQTAYELRMTRWPAMSMGGRVAGRERMHAALARQKRRKAGFLSPFWRQAGVTVALMLVAGAAFLASPFSPLDFPGARGVTPTDVAPVVVGAPTATFTSVPARVSPTVTWTATAPATPAPAATAEPSETPERLRLVERTRVVLATSTRAASPTRRFSPTSAPALAATATLVATASPTETGGASGATTPPPPSPTRAPATATLTPTRVKPSPTLTSVPTERPEPTFTLTPQPPTPSLTPPKPSVTPSPPPTMTPSAEPTETPRRPAASKTPRHTPRPTETPEPSKTPPADGAGEAPRPALTALSQARPGPSLPHEMRPAIRFALSPAPPLRRR